MHYLWQFFDWTPISTQWPSWSWNRTSQAPVLLVSLSQLRLLFVIGGCKTGGVINSCLICSNAYIHSCTHWNLFYFSVFNKLIWDVFSDLWGRITVTIPQKIGNPPQILILLEDNCICYFLMECVWRYSIFQHDYKTYAC